MNRTTVMWVGFGLCCGLVFCASVAVGNCSSGCKSVDGFKTGTGNCFEFEESNALKASIYAHEGTGGTYSRETPSRKIKAYTNCTCSTPDDSDCTSQQTPQENDTTNCSTNYSEYNAAECAPK